MDDPLPDGPASSALRVAVHIDHESLSFDAASVRRTVRHVLRCEGVASAEINVVLSNEHTVWRLNREFLNHDHATDVLTFPLTDGDSDLLEGEIYVDMDMASARASEFAATFDLELLRYVVHGVLHLVGYADATAPEKAKMRELEDTYLRHQGGSS